MRTRAGDKFAYARFHGLPARLSGSRYEFVIPEPKILRNMRQPIAFKRFSEKFYTARMELVEFPPHRPVLIARVRIFVRRREQ